MSIPDFEGLGILYQAISEGLEIEKCSICLERLENTVLLWPCTHWFCNNCISTLHKSSRGEKVACPLCKSTTTRRKVLPFQDKQKEYEDHLQTLIGALSLDLKFDVTSYNNVRKCELPSTKKILEVNNPVVLLSPLRKTKTKAAVKIIEVKKKPNVQKNKKITRSKSGDFQPKNKNIAVVKNNETNVNESPKFLPDSPGDSPKQKKVKEWLASNKFSQADSEVCVETVIADVHNAEHNESLCFSETALQSVSQVDYKNIQTPIRPKLASKRDDSLSDVDVIKVYNKSSENMFSTKGLCKNKNPIPMPAVDKFDELFPENRKMQTVTTTYGSKNPHTSTCKRGQRFAVKIDVFQNNDENKGENETSNSDDILKTSEESFEGFSSGSGEEWTIEKKTKKSNFMSKGKALKNNIKLTAQIKRKKSIQNFLSSMPMKSSLRNHVKRDFKAKKCIKNRLPNQKNSNKDVDKTIFKCGVEEFSKPKEDAVKEIIDDWNDTKDSNSLLLAKTYASNNTDVASLKTKSKKIAEVKSETTLTELNRNKMSPNIQDKVIKTPCKEVSTRSPGWSRLKSTKKEFNLSEKKKLSLKTFNVSKSSSSLISTGISPLLNQSKTSCNSLNQTNPAQPIVQKVQSPKSISMDSKVYFSKNDMNDQSINKLDVHCETKVLKTPEMNKNLNTSLASSASASSFRGFPTPEEKENLNRNNPNFDQFKETPQKSENSVIFCRSQMMNDKSNTILDKHIADCSLDNYSKEDSMQVDIILCENPQLQFKNKKISISNENLSTLSKTPEENCKSLKNLNSLEASKVTNAIQEEPKGCSIFSKKRDRDSGIHNESGISSPIRKRVCIDAEVQTSPSRMQSVVRDMLKDMWGIELEEMIQQLNKKTDSLKNHDTIHATCPQSFERFSQDSDKENFYISSKNENVSISKKCFDDSDIILGTEDCTSDAHLKPLDGIFINNMRTQKPLGLRVLEGQEIVDFNDVDPDAPTQPYKTPRIPKRSFQTSTKDYTVVSNPSSSEIKRTDALFDKSDVRFPDVTPSRRTPWNYSGVNELEENSVTIKQSAVKNDIIPLSQSLKEKSNKSRRQLEFREENSNDIFEFERQTSGKLSEVVGNYEANNCEHGKVGALHENTDEVDDIFLEGNEQLDRIISSPSKDTEASSLDNNNLMTKQQEVSLSNEIQSENLSDTPGIVEPSEGYCVDNRIDLSAPNKGKDAADSNNSAAVDQVVMCSPITNVHISEVINQNNLFPQSTIEVVKTPSKLHQVSPLMFKESSAEQNTISANNYVNTKDDDQASISSSNISFVEGTPDVPNCEENLPGILDFSNKIENGTEPEKNDGMLGEVCIGEKKAKSAISLYECVTGDIGLNKQEEFRQEEKCVINNDQSNCDEMNENTESEDDNLCFASSLLNLQQNQALACVLGGLGLSYSKTVGNHISHLIVGTKNGCFQNTYKVLHAMALHKPIIRFDWVEEVIRTGGTVPLDPFVALDPSGECGVLRAKSDKNRELLRNFAVHIYNVNDRIVLKEQIEELVKLCGGIVVKELHHFYKVPRDKFRIIVLSEPPDSLTQGDWRQKYLAAEVMIDWIYNTIGRYRVMPLVPFMMTDSADAVLFLQHEGYPKELIFDLSTQE